jgi:hypothetical protein
MRAAIRVRVVAAVALALVVAFVLGFEGHARAFDDFEGTRSVGMGGSGRAWALADSAVLLNPSGMSLAKAYNVEASYAYGSRLREQFLHASVVDSTSATNLAGGLYYTYRFDKTTGLASGHGHEVGGALSLPIGTSVALGATLKWFRLVGADNGPAAPGATWDGFTTDVGATVRPDPTLSFAVVGANLVDKHRGQVPRMVTYGAAYLPIPEIVLALDGVTSFTRDDVTGTRGTGFRAGIEGALAQRVALRAGGGTDPVAGMGYLAAGFSAVSEIGALDLGVRGDLFQYRTGGTRNLFLGVSLRLFVPGAVASAAATQSP